MRSVSLGCLPWAGGTCTIPALRAGDSRTTEALQLDLDVLGVCSDFARNGCQVRPVLGFMAGGLSRLMESSQRSSSTPPAGGHWAPRDPAREPALHDLLSRGGASDE